MKRVKSENKDKEDDIYKMSKDELIQEDILSSKEANKLIESKKQNKREATKIGILSYLSNILNKLTEKYSYKKSYGEIKSVTVDENIKLHIEYNNNTTTIEISSGSDIIPNLLEYHSVDKLQDLENRSIYIKYIDFIENNTIGTSLPHNVSLVGILRYKLYTNMMNILGLLYYKMIYIPEVIFVSLIMFPSVVLLATQSTFSFILLLPFAVLIGYVLINFLFAILSFILYTDNFKNHTSEYNN